MLGFLKILAPFWYILPLLALTASTAYYKHEVTTVRTEFSNFKVQLAAATAKAEIEKAQKEKDNAERINHAIASRDSAISRLRNQVRSSSSFVPRDTGAATASGAVCYDAAGLNAAIQRLDSGVQEIAGSGAEAVINLLSILQSWPK